MGEVLSDSLIILLFKIIIMFGFVFSLNFWLRKTNSIFPVIIYWVLGVPFVLVVSFGMFQWFYTILLLNDGLFRQENLGSMASLTSLAFYIFLGIKFLKRKK